MPIVSDMIVAFIFFVYSQLVDKFEFTYNVNILSPKWLESNLSHLFLQFFHFMYKGGLEEFEDYEERAPSGCVSVLTIHQSKGLEFSVTCVGSLTRNPRKAYTDLDAILEQKYFHREPFEPLERIKYFDFWREYYVAFSRPQNLLVLTGALDKKDRLGKTFDDVVGKIESYQFSNKHVKKCAQLCDSCDLRFFCNYK